MLDIPNYQGVAVVNYTDAQNAYTSVIEHKNFTFGAQSKTTISREYSDEWKPGVEPHYPIGNIKNASLYHRNATLATAYLHLMMDSRLDEYAYQDIDDVVAGTFRYAHAKG